MYSEISPNISPDNSQNGRNAISRLLLHGPSNNKIKMNRLKKLLAEGGIPDSSQYDRNSVNLLLTDGFVEDSKTNSELTIYALGLLLGVGAIPNSMEGFDNSISVLLRTDIDNDYKIIALTMLLNKDTKPENSQGTLNSIHSLMNYGGNQDINDRFIVKALQMLLEKNAIPLNVQDIYNSISDMLYYRTSAPNKIKGLELLLDNGALPNNSESIIHNGNFNSISLLLRIPHMDSKTKMNGLKLLLEKKAKPHNGKIITPDSNSDRGGRKTIYNNNSIYTLLLYNNDGEYIINTLEQLLQNGATPVNTRNVYNSINMLIESKIDTKFKIKGLELLLANGATPVNIQDLYNSINMLIESKIDTKFKITALKMLVNNGVIPVNTQDIFNSIYKLIESKIDTKFKITALKMLVNNGAKIYAGNDNRIIRNLLNDSNIQPNDKIQLFILLKNNQTYDDEQLKYFKDNELFVDFIKMLCMMSNIYYSTAMLTQLTNAYSEPNSLDDEVGLRFSNLTDEEEKKLNEKDKFVNQLQDEKIKAIYITKSSLYKYIIMKLEQYIKSYGDFNKLPFTIISNIIKPYLNSEETPVELLPYIKTWEILSHSLYQIDKKPPNDKLIGGFNTMKYYENKKKYIRMIYKY